MINMRNSMRLYSTFSSLLGAVLTLFAVGCSDPNSDIGKGCT